MSQPALQSLARTEIYPIPADSEASETPPATPAVPGAPIPMPASRQLPCLKLCNGLDRVAQVGDDRIATIAQLRFRRDIDSASVPSRRSPRTQIGSTEIHANRITSSLNLFYSLYRKIFDDQQRSGKLVRMLDDSPTTGTADNNACRVPARKLRLIVVPDTRHGSPYARRRDVPNWKILRCPSASTNR